MELALKGHLVQQDKRDHLELLVHQEPQEGLEHQAVLGHQELLDQLALPVIRDLKDHQVLLDHQVHPVTQEQLVTLDHKELREIVGHRVQLEQLGQRAEQDQVDRQE